MAGPLATGGVRAPPGTYSGQVPPAAENGRCISERLGHYRATTTAMLISETARIAHVCRDSAERRRPESNPCLIPVVVLRHLSRTIIGSPRACDWFRHCARTDSRVLWRRWTVCEPPCRTVAMPRTQSSAHPGVATAKTVHRRYTMSLWRARLLQTQTPPERGFPFIGETGFEPATARPPAGCATRLRHSPWSI